MATASRSSNLPLEVFYHIAEFLPDSPRFFYPLVQVNRAWYVGFISGLWGTVSLASSSLLEGDAVPNSQSALPTFPALLSIHLHHLRHLQGSCSSIEQFLARFPSHRIRSLNLCDDTAARSSAPLLLPSSSSIFSQTTLHSITSLSLVQCSLTAELLSAVIMLLPQLRVLTMRHVEARTFGDQLWGAFLDSLDPTALAGQPSNPSSDSVQRLLPSDGQPTLSQLRLQILEVAFSPVLGDAVLARLIKLAGTRLRVLDISSPHHVHSPLVEQISQSATRLRSLTMRYRTLDPGAVAKILDACNELTRVDFRNTFEIQPDGSRRDPLVHYQTRPHQLHKLKSLAFEDTDPSVFDFTSLLAHHRSLPDLGRNLLELVLHEAKVVSGTLVAVLQFMPNLRRLQAPLPNTARFLAVAKQCPNLQQLCWIGPICLQDFDRLAPHALKKLQSLEFRFATWARQDDTFSSFLAAHPVLDTLVMTGACGLDPASLAKLKQRHPATQIRVCSFSGKPVSA
ncbi:uncharacterized protein BJ171DRAFT_211368 [Polychytrium aggregatum]|uniref:uncharacterized protein n=1 Tax=Polychytrium aggregatum TaxID=110093 RepID=UPI0022FEDFB7|nr:uncharacterized protein BJ171DRAFT_211368 [Polychytrium aggregatum]KAI9208635.1 hypothetical protein BJ171DRAFT_211368 [Polychytrium aggregatum]